MARSWLARAGVILTLVSPSACSGGPSSLTWEVETNGYTGAALRLEVLAGACATGTVVWQQDVVWGARMAGTPPVVGAGTYCLRARAVDASCDLVAWAEEEVALPRRDGVPVLLTLDRDASRMAPPICETLPCDDPLCAAPALDAGLDGGRPDGGLGGCAHGGATLDAPPPTGFLPWSGWATGSLTSEVDTSFTWSPVPGAGCYELQLSDACAPGAMGSCDFAGATLHTSETTSIAVPLATSAPMGAPVGRRWTWRVRACAESGCTDWGRPRYLDAGRSRSDVDGDGLPDVAALSALPDNVMHLYVRFGGVTPRVVELDLPDGAAGVVARGGRWVTTCDLDADGRQDLVVGVPTATALGTLQAGRVFVFMGPGGSGGAPAIGTVTTNAQLGAAVACGDVDNDGYADIVVGGPGTNRVEIHRGGPDAPNVPEDEIIALVGPRMGASFGNAIAVGDVAPDTTRAPDGIVDIVVGAPELRRLYGFRGAEDLASLLTTATPPSISPFFDVPFATAPTTFGESLLLAQLDGTAGADLVVAAPDTAASSGTGAVYFVRSGAWGAALPSAVRSPIGAGMGFGVRFGAALAAACTSDPGAPCDLYVGAPGADDGGNMDVGAVFRLAAGSAGPATPGAALRGASGAAGYFGLSLAAEIAGTRGDVTVIGGEPGGGVVWPADGSDRLEPLLQEPGVGHAVAFGGP